MFIKEDSSSYACRAYLNKMKNAYTYQFIPTMQ